MKNWIIKTDAINNKFRFSLTHINKNRTKFCFEFTRNNNRLLLRFNEKNFLSIYRSYFSQKYNVYLVVFGKVLIDRNK